MDHVALHCSNTEEKQQSIFKMFLLSTAIARLHSVEAISYIKRLVCVASRPINRTLSSDEYPPGHQRQAAEAATIPLSHHASIIFLLSPQYNVDKKICERCNAMQ
jgi:hypothetical protein